MTENDALMADMTMALRDLEAATEGYRLAAERLAAAKKQVSEIKRRLAFNHKQARW